MHAIVHVGVGQRKRKIPCRTGESILRRRRAGPMLNQLYTITAGVYEEFRRSHSQPLFLSTLFFTPTARAPLLCHRPPPGPMLPPSPPQPHVTKDVILNASLLHVLGSVIQSTFLSIFPPSPSIHLINRQREALQL